MSSSSLNTVWPRLLGGIPALGWESTWLAVPSHIQPWPKPSASSTPRSKRCSTESRKSDPRRRRDGHRNSNAQPEEEPELEAEGHHAQEHDRRQVRRSRERPA